MRDLINKVLDDYLNFYNSTGKSSEHEIADIIINQLPEAVYNLLDLDKDKYRVVASYGMGNRTNTPWISIFDKSITKSAKKGFYVVYLFKEDMTGVYLSLNQGTSFLKKKFKGHKPKQKMSEVAIRLRDQIDLPQDNFNLLEIDLKSGTDNAKNYNAANICSKLYLYESLPSEVELKKDLLELLEGLESVKKFIGTRDLNLVLDELIFMEEKNDAMFQSNILLAKPTETDEKPAPLPQRKTITTDQWERNASIAKESLINSNYRCELDESHETFISLISEKNYVEAHHLIPMNRQVEFQYSLDVPGNIVSLCPNCHRKVHHAISAEKKNLLSKLFIQRKDTLGKYGIEVALDNLFKFYNV